MFTSVVSRFCHPKCLEKNIAIYVDRCRYKSWKCPDAMCLQKHHSIMAVCILSPPCNTTQYVTCKLLTAVTRFFSFLCIVYSPSDSSSNVVVPSSEPHATNLPASCTRRLCRGTSHTWQHHTVITGAPHEEHLKPDQLLAPKLHGHNTATLIIAHY